MWTLQKIETTKKIETSSIKLCVKWMHTINIELVYQETTLYETKKLKFIFPVLCFSNKFGADCVSWTTHAPYGWLRCCLGPGSKEGCWPGWDFDSGFLLFSFVGSRAVRMRHGVPQIIEMNAWLLSRRVHSCEFSTREKRRYRTDFFRMPVVLLRLNADIPRRLRS